ncbi:Pentatricopeptide repeat [Populus alba x Populus x berolinensis]|nr:Pentatricopeptide repeat [Populus alba x Populus x berolinensis]
MGLIDLARDVFDEIVDKDRVLWNLMVHAYVKAECPNEALDLFEKMDSEGVIPDENTMVSVLLACASISDLQCARLVHRFINRNSNVRQDVFLKTALINMYSKCGSVEEALVTFYKMEYTDVFTWTAMIEGLANNGYGNEALSMFNRMENQGIRPNEATLVSVLTACIHSGLVKEGCQLFKSMVSDYKMQLKMEHFGCLIDLLSRAGLLHQAEEFIQLLLPEERLIAYKTLLSACMKYSEFDFGKKVANEMSKLSSNSHETGILLSNFYALAGQWTQVAETRKFIKEFDTRKAPGMSFVDVKP